MLAELEMPKAPPTEDDMRLAQESSRRLSRVITRDQPLRIEVTDDGRQVVEIPATAARQLLRLLAEMAKGNVVTLIPVHAELTTQRVADLLGVSRPFIVNEIEAGRLPARRVGTHRRVLFEDFLRYKQGMDAARLEALDKLAELDQELGLE